jgi:hypothetical protein
MNDRIRRQYNTLNTLSAFITANAADYSATSALPDYAATMKDVATKIDTAKAGQLGGSGADITDGLLQALKTDLQNIGGIARPMDALQPGLKDKFPTVGTTTQSIVTTADAYLTQLEIKLTDDTATKAAKNALAQLFIDHEMPSTFVADLRADRDAIPVAVVDETNTEKDKVKDTASLNVLSRQGMQTRDLAIAALRACYTRQPEKLRAAESAAHVERAPQRSDKKKSADKSSGVKTDGGPAPAK